MCQPPPRAQQGSVGSTTTSHSPCGSSGAAGSLWSACGNSDNTLHQHEKATTWHGGSNPPECSTSPLLAKEATDGVGALPLRFPGHPPWRTVLRDRCVVTKGRSCKHRLERPGSARLVYFLQLRAGQEHTDTSLHFWGFSPSPPRSGQVLHLPSEDTQPSGVWQGYAFGSVPWIPWCVHLGFSSMFLEKEWSCEPYGPAPQEGKSGSYRSSDILMSSSWMHFSFTLLILSLPSGFYLTKQLFFPFKRTHLPLSSLHAMFSVWKCFFIWTATDCFLFLLLLQVKKYLYFDLVMCRFLKQTRRKTAMSVFAPLVRVPFHISTLTVPRAQEDFKPWLILAEHSIYNVASHVS